MTKAKRKPVNVTRATLVGASAGVGGSVVVTWLALEAQRRYGLPAEVAAALLGPAFAFVARWAAKLNPDD